jgi:hypothetical protein
MNFFGYYGGLAPLLSCGGRTKTPTNATCAWCSEPILHGEDGVAHENGACEHIECFIRSIVGSVAHQKHRCPCYGGSDDHEEKGMTKRAAARAAFENWQRWGAADANPRHPRPGPAGNYSPTRERCGTEMDLSNLFRQLHAGDYALVKFVLDAGKRHPVGSPVAINRAEMKRHGLEIVLNQLPPAFGHTSAKWGCELYAMPVQHKRGTRPRSVAIWREPGEKLVLQAANPNDETCIVINGGHHASINLPSDNDQFFKILDATFDDW